VPQSLPLAADEVIERALIGGCFWHEREVPTLPLYRCFRRMSGRKPLRTSLEAL